MAPVRRPDFSRLLTTLRCGKPDAIPLIELGIHPTKRKLSSGGRSSRLPTMPNSCARWGMTL